MSENDQTGFNGLAAPAALEPDMERYRALLGDADITKEQADELIVILYNIMRSFVELGYSPDLCGKLLDVSEDDSALIHEDVD